MKKEGVNIFDLKEGGGLINDVDVEWKECRWEMFDYAGTRKEEAPVLRITMDVDGEDHNENYTCGQDWEPSKDGLSIVPLAGQTGINKSSKAGMLFQSLIDNGIDQSKVGDSVSNLEGIVAHMVRVPLKAGGLPTKVKRADGREFEKTCLIVEKVIKWPWDRGSKGAKKETLADNEALEMASQAIMAILQENPKGIDKMKLIGQVFTYLKKEKCSMELVNSSTKLIREDAVEGPWTVKNGVYSM